MGTYTPFARAVLTAIRHESTATTSSTGTVRRVRGLVVVVI